MIGQQSSGTETELAALLKDKADKSATLCQEVSNLTASLQQYQDMVKVRNMCAQLSSLLCNKKNFQAKFFLFVFVFKTTKNHISQSPTLSHLT